MLAATRILTINGGSSTIKFAVFTKSAAPRRTLIGQVDRIGPNGAVLRANAGEQSLEMAIAAGDHRQAARALIDWIQDWSGADHFTAIGHRVVHGGITVTEHQVVTPELVRELCRTQPLDLAHLPREIALIEAFAECFPGVPQIACFDTAFHRDLPPVAQILPIPRRYREAGLRRLGFHGLSFMYLIDALRRIDADAANGRVILAHLGSGASMTALRHGRPIDTSMALTPTGGLVMSTRPGDLDPGLLVYLMRTERLTPEQMDAFISHDCGMAGVSGTTSDMRELLRKRAADRHAAEAVELFCYEAKKWVGTCAAALGGLDSMVFSGGIGEHSSEVRAGICEGLEFLGVQLDEALNSSSAPVISAETSRVTVRVIPTDEELMIAQIVFDLISSRER